MKKVLLPAALLMPLLTMAQAQTRQYETFAIAGFFLIALGGIITYYVIWNKNKGNTKKGDHEKYVIKTFEVVKNGRKVVMTKKYRVTDEQEFPETVRRKK